PRSAVVSVSVVVVAIALPPENTKASLSGGQLGACAVKVVRSASQTRREPRHRGDRHRRDKGETHLLRGYGTPGKRVKPRDASCTVHGPCRGTSGEGIGYWGGKWGESWSRS